MREMSDMERLKEALKEAGVEIDDIPDEALEGLAKVAEKVIGGIPKAREEDTDMGRLLRVKTLYQKGDTGISVGVPVEHAVFLGEFMGAGIKHIIDEYDECLADHKFKSMEEAVGQYTLDLISGILGFFNDNPEKRDEYAEMDGKLPKRIPQDRNPMFG